MYAMLFDNPEMINEILPRYLSTTAEQIRDVCASVFRADNRVVLTYLPTAATEATPAPEPEAEAGTEAAESAA